MSAIPFEHMDEAKALNEPNSPFMDFFMSLKGYFVFDRKTRQQVFTYELWHKYKSRKDILDMISNHSYPSYIFIPKHNWK